jgi:hypothetical protein
MILPLNSFYWYNLMHLFLFLILSKSVAYEVKVKSEAEMKTMSTKMTSTFSDSQTFTKEMQQTMTTNNVESVSPNTITADTSATPAEVDTRGKDNSINNDDTTKPIPDDEINAGVIAAAVLVPLLVIAAIVGAVVWYREHHNNGTKNQEEVVEMVSLEAPTLETNTLFERRGSMNSINPLVNHTTSTTSNAPPEVLLGARPDAFMSQAPPPPQKRIESIDVEIYQDERTGRRYSFNSQTQETKWLEDEDTQTGNPTVATLTNEDPTVEIHTDPTSGKRYSWNATTSEATWLDGN